MLAQLNWRRRVHGAGHDRAAPSAVRAVLRAAGRIARDLEQDRKMLAGGLWHRPGAASAGRAVHATGRMLAGLGHLRAGLAAKAMR